MTDHARYLTMYGTIIFRDNAFLEYAYDNPHLIDQVRDDPALDVVIGPKGDDYIVFGKLFFDSGDIYEEFRDTYAEIDLMQLSNARNEAITVMARVFPDYVHHMLGEWKLMTFVSNVVRT